MDITALFKMSYGVYLISSINGKKYNGQIANVVSQVAAEPLLVVICINKKNYTHDFIDKSGKFAITVLSEDTPMEFIGKFGFKTGRDVDKFENTTYEIGVTGVPVVIDFAVSVMEAKVVNKMEITGYTLFIGEIMEAKNISDKEPLTYAYYHKVKKGKAPKSAPTFKSNMGVDIVNKKKENIMKKFRCTVCGYIYDPEKGDDNANVPAGTTFENLPEDWVCPVCGVGKDMFEEA